MRQNSSLKSLRKTISLLAINHIAEYRKPFCSIVSITLLFFYFSVGTCIGQNSTYIINGDFSSPIVPDRQLFEYYSMLGWNCTWICQLKNCSNQKQYWTSQGQIYADCITQAIDLNSINFNQIATQQIQLTVGSYLLSFNYYYPIMKANLKQLKAYFNNITIVDIRPTISASSQRFYTEIIINATEGINILKFQNLGYSADGYGFRINNVSLYNYTVQINNTSISQNNTQNSTLQNSTSQNTTQNSTQNNTQNSQNISQNTTQNESKLIVESNGFLDQFISIFFHYSGFTNNIPGGRVIFRSLMSFLINFDRLQLYIYHNRLYSANGQLLILSVNNFLNTKSALASHILNIVKDGVVLYQNQLTNQTNYKQSYIYYKSFNDEYQNPEYLDNINQSFVYFLPFIIIFIIILNILFKIFFQKPISLLFRKFQLWVILLIMMFDGNIESITFHTFGELKIFFSQCFHHKIFNVFILMFFYLLVFIVFPLLFWVKYHYGKKARYILDEAESRLDILWGISIDRGIICFLFGMFHQLLIDSPNMQILLLGIIELLWIIKKIIFISKGLYKQKLLICASIMSGFSRIIFQVSFYLYQKQDLRYIINQYIHSSLIYVIVSSALLEIIVGLFYCFKSLWAICIMDKRKIVNQKCKIKDIMVEKNLDEIHLKKNRNNALLVQKIIDSNIQNESSFLYCLNGRTFKFHKNQPKNKRKIKKTNNKKVNIIG